MKAVGSILLAFFSFLSNDAFSADESNSKIKIGVLADLTGSAAAYGTDVRNGVVFAESKFGNGRFELIIEDTRCSGKEAVSAAHKLVTIDKVRYAIGFGCSGALLAAAPIFERSKVLVIGTATSAPAITDAGEYIFRTWPSDEGSAEVLYDYIKTRHQVIGVVTEETDFSQGITQALLRQNEGGKLKIVNENVPPESPDFRSVLTKIRSAGVEAVFLNNQSEIGLIQLYRQLLEMRFRVPVYANYNAGSPAFRESFKNLADGVIFFDAPFLDSLANAHGRQLYQEFVKRFGEPRSSPLYVLTSVAGFAALAEAINSGQEARTYLHRHRFSHVISDLGFDANGDPTGISLVLKTIKDGLVIPLN